MVEVHWYCGGATCAAILPNAPTSSAITCLHDDLILRVIRDLTFPIVQ